ncbi:hypothetical protein L195_g019239 [Trifolium pratense]|uniref:Uncharacterized protein n=1 Tax=Trifolium pratense TaxID=57577 RepID=A0A2K3MZ15_TRIPR|nr:hypothetical protein L195_g019239 [Trifolium pratense]
MSSDEAVISNGNGVAEEARCSKSDVVNDGAVLMNVNGVAEVNEVLKSDGLNNGVNVNGVTEEDGGLKSEPISNGAAISDGFDSGDGGSCGVTCLRTYKRRKYDKSSSKGKAQEDRKKCVETASHIADQVAKEPFDATLGNTADDCDHRHWGNVVLKHLHQSLGSVNGGIGEAKIDRLSHRTRTEANGYAPVMQSGSSSESHGHGGTEMCQRMLCEVLTSEMFNSLCKTIFENFQGIKPESVVDFSVVISRMQQKFYENSPELFLSDIQQIDFMAVSAVCTYPCYWQTNFRNRLTPHFTLGFLLRYASALPNSSMNSDSKSSPLANKLQATVSSFFTIFFIQHLILCFVPKFCACYLLQFGTLYTVMLTLSTGMDMHIPVHSLTSPTSHTFSGSNYFC